MSDSEKKQLTAVVAGKHLDEDAARRLWASFSLHMDEHRGDFEGFAALQGAGFAYVQVTDGVPTLTLSDDPPAAQPAGKTKGASSGKSSKRRGKESGGRKRSAGKKRG